MGTLLNCAASCATIAWWINGIIWRFKASGSFASGDELTADELSAESDNDATLYQLQSGKFLLIYYIITWVIIGAGLGFACCTSFMACCGFGKSSDF